MDGAEESRAASDPPALKVVISPTAAGELLDVWVSNERRYGARHAESYAAFLHREIEELGSDPSGRPVENSESLRRKTIKRRPRGDGHIVVFEVRAETGTVDVLHVFHTRMDLPARLCEG